MAKFPYLRKTANWMGDHSVVKLFPIGQPAWPNQPSNHQGSVIEL